MCVYVCLTGLAPLAGLSGIFLRGRGGCRRTIKLLRRSRSCLRLGIALIRYTQAAVRIYVLRVCERERVCVCRCDHPSPFFARGCTHSTHTHNTRARAHTHTHRNTYTHTHTIYIYIYIYIYLAGFLFGGQGAPSPLGRHRCVLLLVVCCPRCRSGGWEEDRWWWRSCFRIQ
jgi:hypothetical protein